MTIQYITNGNEDGSVIGAASTDKIGFYGATPVVQQSLVTTVATTATTTATVTITQTSAWGFGSSTAQEALVAQVYANADQLNTVSARLNTLITQLRALGLQASA